MRGLRIWLLFVCFALALPACKKDSSPVAQPVAPNAPGVLAATYTPTFLLPTNTPTETPTASLTPTATGTPTPYPTTCFWGEFDRNGFLYLRVTASTNSYATQFTLPSGASIHRVHMSLASLDACSIRMGVYSDSSGAPSTRLAVTSSVAVSPTGGGYQTYTAELTPPKALAAGVYWLAGEVYTPSVCDFFFGRDSTETTKATLHKGASLDNPFPAGTEQTDYKFPCSIWADICP